MPNHFHLMVHVSRIENATLSGTLNHKTLNNSIGKMLSSYTRAINIQEKSTGSLFRGKTKAECVTKSKGIAPSYYKSSFGTIINLHLLEKDYPKICFDYIHNNPVKAKLVKKPENWEFSSYSDYFCSRNGKLINKERAKEFLII